jgi:hypothetical protein
MLSLLLTRAVIKRAVFKTVFIAGLKDIFLGDSSLPFLSATTLLVAKSGKPTHKY